MSPGMSPEQRSASEPTMPPDMLVDKPARKKKKSVPAPIDFGNQPADSERISDPLEPNIELIPETELSEPEVD